MKKRKKIKIKLIRVNSSCKKKTWKKIKNFKPKNKQIKKIEDKKRKIIQKIKN